jgi:DNA helicase-2/ATP-dependent DNA helicase PcrA
MVIANVCYGIPGRDIIAIAYNRHAAQDIEKKYQLLARRINDFTTGKMHIDTDIKATTMHAWCLTWVDEYKSRWKIRDVRLLETESEAEFMKKSLTRYLKSKKNEEILVTDSLVQNLLQLNTWIRETLSENKPDEWSMCSSRSDLLMFSSAELSEIFNNYTRTKQLLGYQDYQDLIQYMWDLLQDPEVLARIRRVHKYFVVDEYQDITPSMLRILNIIMEGSPSIGVEPYKDGYLTCIGDGDQSIYGFRGTDSENCIRFKESYPDAVITAMSINRRCDAKILDYARKIIESNINRIEKPIRGLHDGGDVSIAYYNSEIDQIGKVIETLHQIPLLRKSCICYRNLQSSQFIVVKLLEAGIPFNIGRGIEPFSDIFSRSIEDILTLLEHPNTPMYAEKVLYKFVPRGQGFTKDGLNMFFKKHQEELKTSRRGNFIEAKNFWEYSYGSWHNQKGFTSAIEILHKAHLAIRSNQPMNNFMPVVLDLLRKYYIDSLRKGLFSDKLSDAYINFIERYYTQPMSYKSFKHERDNMFEKMKSDRADGVYLTTMHGLKGLEFDNVIVIDMDDNLYPGNELKNSSLSEEQRGKIEWEARRLLYVTVTRAKHNLKLMFNNNCPSRYIKFFVESDDLVELYGKAGIPQLTSGTISNATGNMIQKLTEDFSDEEFIFEDDISSSLLTDVVNADNKTKESNKDDADDFTNLFGNLDTDNADEDAIFDKIFGDATNDSGGKESDLFAELFDDKPSKEKSAPSKVDDITDLFDDIINEVKEEDKKPIANVDLPWAENPNNAGYKPTLSAMLEILRNREGS